MSVRKEVWLVMKRNGANKDLRLLFSKFAARRHFEYATHSLRFQRRKMQSKCHLNPLIDVWRVCSEMTCRVSMFRGCDCGACDNSVDHLCYHAPTRMWLRFQMPYLSHTDSPKER